MRNIQRYFNVIDKALFRIDGNLDYTRIQDALRGLVREINTAETDDATWSIGECGACTLSDLIVGAFWHFADWHGGQSSYEYETLSILGDLFSPGMSSSEPDNAAYQALDQMALALHGTD